MMFYKETNFKAATMIGKIPMNWEVVMIHEICEFKRGFSYRSDQISEDATNTRFITINDYEKEGGFKQNNERLYLRDDIGPDSDFILNQEDVLIANTDMSRGFIIGAPIHIESVEGKLVYSMDSTKLIFDKNKMSGKFLFYLLKHEKVRQKVKTLAQGTNVLHLNHELLKSLRIPLPPLSEQLAIVGVLGVVDSAIGLVDEVIWKTERLKKGLMQQLLTRGIGHKEYKDTPIGKTPKTWQVSRFGDTVKVQGGFAFKSVDYVNEEVKKKTIGDEEGVPLIRIANVSFGHVEFGNLARLPDSYLDTYRDFALEENDIVIVLTRPIIEGGIKAAKIEKSHTPSLLNQRVGRFRIVDRSKILPDFLFHVVFSDIFVRQVKRGLVTMNQPNISPNEIERFRILLPPLPEQQQIAATLSTINTKLELETSEKGKLERVKRGLMDLLLTGKVRVKVD